MNLFTRYGIDLSLLFFALLALMGAGDYQGGKGYALAVIGVIALRGRDVWRDRI